MRNAPLQSCEGWQRATRCARRARGCCHDAAHSGPELPGVGKLGQGLDLLARCCALKPEQSAGSGSLGIRRHKTMRRPFKKLQGMFTQQVASHALAWRKHGTRKCCCSALFKQNVGFVSCNTDRLRCCERERCHKMQHCWPVTPALAKLERASIAGRTPKSRHRDPAAESSHVQHCSVSMKTCPT